MTKGHLEEENCQEGVKAMSDLRPEVTLES